MLPSPLPQLNLSTELLTFLSFHLVIGELNDAYTRLVVDNDIDGLTAMYDPEVIVISGGTSKQGIHGKISSFI